MSSIRQIRAREILDSRGYPTIEVELTLSNGLAASACVPSGASTGAHEAHELRDGDSSRYSGKGVLNACSNVNYIISQHLMGDEVTDQKGIDEKLIKLDGTENKSNLGANAMLGVSLAAARAAASLKGVSLFRMMGNEFRLPVPLMNVLNGGAHADNGVDVQEFMIVPIVGGSFSQSLRAGCEIFHKLKRNLKAKGLSTGVGDEGGVAPKLRNNREALDLISEAIMGCGYKLGEQIFLALDVAATELYSDGSYRWEGKRLSPSELLSIYKNWASAFPIISVEDGFSEDDWVSWAKFTETLGGKLQIVGDDLFVTNPKRIQLGIEKRAANALLVKCNQIGTLTETIQAVRTAQNAGFMTIMSHRSGETEDPIIADLSVGMGCQQIKTGSLCRGERTAKYNQLLRIEEELGDKASYWGRDAFNNI